jgi:undecaprenyl-diphosphatase
MRSAKLSGRSLACLITSSLLFACVLAAVLLQASEDVDGAIRTAVNSWANPNLTSFFLFATQLGSVAVVYALTAIEAVALMVLRRWRDAVYLLAVMAAAAAVNNAVKYAVARARPEAFFGDLPASYSFASGHALYSGCVYGVLGGLLAAEMSRGWQKGLILLLTLALIGVIGLSRIYLGVHYPTDVVAGFALAALIVCIARAVLGPRTAPG